MNFIKYVSLSLVLSLLQFAVASVDQKQIAETDSFSVSTNDIHVTDREINLIFRSQNQSEIDQYRKQSENKNFLNSVYGHIIDEEISIMGLSVSVEEADERLKSNITRSGFNENHVEQINQIYRKLSDALEFALQNPKVSKDLVYQNMLEGSDVNQAQWSFYLEQYNTLAKIEKLKSLIPENTEDVISMSRKSTEQDLLLEKLKMKKLGVSEAEIATVETAEKWGEWLKQKLAVLEIKVYDERFYALLKEAGALNARLVDQREIDQFIEPVDDLDDSSDGSIGNKTAGSSMGESPSRLPWLIGCITVIVIIGVALRFRKNK